MERSIPLNQIESLAAQEQSAAQAKTLKILASVQNAVLVLTYIATPLCLGGRHASGAFVFLVLLCLLGILGLLRSTFAREAFKLSGFDALLFLAIALLAIQLVPLPNWFIELVSPGVRQHLPLWFSASEGLPTWSTISLVPDATRFGLCLLVAVAILYRVLLSQINSTQDVHRHIRWVGYVTMGLAIVGLAQYFLGNGRYIWIYEHPFQGPGNRTQGPFVNANHFAHFLALGVGPLAWMSVADRPKRKGRRGQWRKENRWAAQNYMASAGLAIVISAAALSLSRGGILSVLLASLVSGVAIYYLRGNQRGSGYGFACVALIVCGILVWNGYETIYRRATDISWESAEALSASSERIIPWTAAARAIPNYILLGSGVGSFQDVYKTFVDDGASQLEYTYAESGYLQVAVETGAIGCILLLSCIGLLMHRSVHLLRDRRYSCLAAILPGLVVSLVHSVVDFVWFIPACLMLTVVLIACLERLYVQSSSETKGAASAELESWLGTPASSRLLRSGMLATGICCVILILQIGYRRASGHRQWERYLINHSLANSLDSAEDTSPRSMLQDVAEADQSKHDTPEEKLDYTIAQLEKCLEQNAWHERAHLRLAESLIHRFELARKGSPNQLGLDQIADAAVASEYASAAELNEWLGRAVGEDAQLLYRAYAHAHQGAQLSPMSGEAYIYLAQLQFLFPDSPLGTADFVDQALTTRPFDGELLLAAAILRKQLGETDGCYQLLKLAFALDPAVRSRILRFLGPRLDPQQFVALIEPDFAGTFELLQFHRENQNGLAAQAIAETFLETAKELPDDLPSNELLGRLKQARLVCDFYERLDDAITFGEQALRAAPNDYELRHELGQRLLKVGRKDEAIKHLRWCLARAPKNGQIRKELRTAMQTIASDARPIYRR